MKENIYLGLFAVLVIVAGVLYFVPTRVEPPLPEPRVLFFSVEPAQFKDGAYVYKIGAEIVVRAENTDHVEIWFMQKAPEAVPSVKLFSGGMQSGEKHFKLEDKNLDGDIWVKAFNPAEVSVESESLYLTHDAVADQPFADEIQIEFPKRDSVVTSPLAVKGRVRGFWFFEASMPVSILDAERKVIVKVPLQAKGDWMTENFVEFEGKIPFVRPNTPSGFVVFENDNPSGDPTHSKSFEVPVRFNK